MTKQTRKDDEIDQIVDEIVADEKTASALKDKLHHSLDEDEAHYARSEDAGDDTDDMWDNMPV